MITREGLGPTKEKCSDVFSPQLILLRGSNSFTSKKTIIPQGSNGSKILQGVGGFRLLIPISDPV